jgi:endonuclease/exonuclease/phosphatase family metal-dependent hydrolase
LTSTLLGSGCSESAESGALPGDGGDAGQVPDAADAEPDAMPEASADAGAGGTDGGPVEAGADGLELLSLNLHCFIPTGSIYSNDLERYEAIAQNVSKLGVQVVTLQEACVTTSRDAAKDLAARLTELTGKPWFSEWQLAHVAWQGTADEAQEGVALLADRPLGKVESTVFAHQQGLTRAALSAEVSLGSGSVRVMSVHLEHLDAAAREEQAREAAVVALAEAYPSAAAIVAGDFNAKEGTPTHAALGQQGFIDASDSLSVNRIDHVFVHRGAELTATQASLVFEGAEAVSDHPGVLVSFSPASSPPVSLTRVRLTMSLAASEFVSIRGSVTPLSWDRGWTLRHDEVAGAWDYVTSELDSDFEYKLLKNDAVWQTGTNQLGSAGKDHVASASF